MPHELLFKYGEGRIILNNATADQISEKLKKIFKNQ